MVGIAVAVIVWSRAAMKRESWDGGQWVVVKRRGSDVRRRGLRRGLSE